MEEVSELAAVGECVLSGGFRTTVLTLPVVVIDVSVLVVAGIWATDTLVLCGKRLKRAVDCCVFDGGHVFADGVTVNVEQACVG